MEYYCMSCGNVFATMKKPRCPLCHGTKVDLVPDDFEELDASDIYNEIIRNGSIQASTPSQEN